MQPTSSAANKPAAKDISHSLSFRDHGCSGKLLVLDLNLKHEEEVFGDLRILDHNLAHFPSDCITFDLLPAVLGTLLALVLLKLSISAYRSSLNKVAVAIPIATSIDKSRAKPNRVLQ